MRPEESRVGASAYKMDKVNDMGRCLGCDSSDCRHFVRVGKKIALQGRKESRRLAKGGTRRRMATQRYKRFVFVSLQHSWV